MSTHDTPDPIDLKAPTDPDLPGLNRPQSLGKMPLLRRPVTLYDPHSNRFEVIAANDNGAMLAGPPPPQPGVGLAPIGKLRLGRRVQGEDHFFLVEVVESEVVEAEEQQAWTRLKVRWCAFAGSEPAETANFAAQKLSINLDARRVRVTRRMAVAPSPAAAQVAKGTPATSQGRVGDVPESVAAPVVVGTTRGHVSQRLSAAPTPTSHPQVAARGAAKHASRRTDGPRKRRNTTPPSGKPKTAPTPAPKMGPVTEDLLLQGRRPIPLGSGE